MKVALGLFTLAGCLFSFAATAAPTHGEMFQALAECKGNAQQVGEFNALVDSEQLKLAKDAAHAPWGGSAWQVKPALTVNGVTSSTAVMTDRFSFFLEIESTNPKVDAEKLASALKLQKLLDNDGYVDYQRSLSTGGVVRVVSTENKDSGLYVGCSYRHGAS
jgi:hypothetical protein